MCYFTEQVNNYTLDIHQLFKFWVKHISNITKVRAISCARDYDV